MFRWCRRPSDVLSRDRTAPDRDSAPEVLPTCRRSTPSLHSLRGRSTTIVRDRNVRCMLLSARQQVYEAAPQAAARQLFVAGYFSRDPFGGGREGIMSEAHGLRFQAGGLHPPLGAGGGEAPAYQTVPIHVWRAEQGDVPSRPMVFHRTAPIRSVRRSRGAHGVADLAAQMPSESASVANKLQVAGACVARPCASLTLVPGTP